MEKVVKCPQCMEENTNLRYSQVNSTKIWKKNTVHFESIGLFPCMQYPVSVRSQIMWAYLSKIDIPLSVLTTFPSIKSIGIYTWVRFWQTPFLADIICEQSLNVLYKPIQCDWFLFGKHGFLRLIWSQIKWMIWQYCSVLGFISHHNSVTEILQLLDYWSLFILHLHT